MKEMQEDAAEQERMMDEHDKDWPLILKQKRTIRGLQEQAVALKQETEDERAAFARAQNKAMSALNGNEKKKKGNRRSSEGSSSKNAHNLQEFITDISRQVSRHCEELLEWQRRHKQSTRAWVSCVSVTVNLCRHFCLYSGFSNHFFCLRPSCFCIYSVWAASHHPKCGDRLNLSESAINWQLS